jgi:hypothetical protein
MATLKVNEDQLRLIQRALDFYSRVGTGQFDEIKNHPTFEKHLREEFKVDGKCDYNRFHNVRYIVDDALNVARNMLYNESGMSKNGSWGIYNPKVDDSCRDAYDLMQVIRHEFWKNDPNRSDITVDSSITLTDRKNNNIECDLD